MQTVRYEVRYSLQLGQTLQFSKGSYESAQLTANRFRKDGRPNVRIVAIVGWP